MVSKCKKLAYYIRYRFLPEAHSASSTNSYGCISYRSLLRKPMHPYAFLYAFDTTQKPV